MERTDPGLWAAAAGMLVTDVLKAAADRHPMSEAAREMLQSHRPEPIEPNSSGLVERLREDARAEYNVRAERAVERNVVAVEEIELAGAPCLEVTPSDWEPGRFILHLYGGGFIVGSAFQDLVLAAPLARLVRAKVVVPDYRLAPEFPFPAALNDVHRVYEALLLRADVKTFALTGESAGGNLALAMLLRATGNGANLPKACALFSPWVDITNGGESLCANEGRDPFLGRDFLELAARLYIGRKRPKQPEISPLFGKIAAGIPPTMISTGTRDLLQSQSLALAEAFQQAGAEVDLRVWAEMWHVFEFYDELPESAQSLATMAAFIVDHFELKFPRNL